jgi:uncharacterized protein YebE (UPF0316 family)
MLKVLMVFTIGLIEQLLYTKYLIAVDKRQTIMSTVYMVVYMSLYLFIVAFALKDANTIPLLVAYALACGAGNYIIMKWENRKNICVLSNNEFIKQITNIINNRYKKNYCSCNNSIKSGYIQSGEYRGYYVCGNCLKPVKK